MEEAGPVVEDLISNHRYKQAVDLAKKIHAREQTSDSEALLAECYLKRIEAFIGKGMSREALGLIDLVDERFPKWRDRLIPLRLSGLARSGNLDLLLAPLLDSELPKAERLAVEEAIRRDIIDLRALAESTALPVDHPLRQGAADVWNAFETVCRGPVDDAGISLPGISRRSPLSSWKMMVRAIAFFYRHDDEACQKCLDQVSPDSAPAALIPIIQDLRNGKQDKDVRGGVRNLGEKISGYSKSLFQLLEEFERALDGVSTKQLLKVINKAVKECERANPELTESLKQHISVRTFFSEDMEAKVNAAMEGPPLKNAAYWRIMAVKSAFDGSQLWSCACWEEFRLHAHQEKLLLHHSAEQAILYLHMAGLCARAEEDPDYSWEADNVKEEFSAATRLYSGQPPHINEAVLEENRDPDRFYFLEPNELFSRACAIGPPEDTFPPWMEHAKNNGGGKALNQVAENWHKADPQNVLPLIFLAEAAEKRKAYKKALNYVQDAERLDELNPGVRRARFRLLIASAKRHITQNKPHLLDKDIDTLQNTPQIQEGDRRVLLGCLKWAGCLLSSDVEGEKRFYYETVSQLNSEVSAYLLLSGLARDCKLPDMKRKMPKIGRRLDDQPLIEAISRLCILGADANIEYLLPEPVRDKLISVLSRKGVKGTAAQFKSLAENAVKRGYLDLAYAASGAGLNLGGYSEAGFLYLRALSLNFYSTFRREKCLIAALELAKKQGDKTLVNEVMEELRDFDIFEFFLSAGNMPDISSENVKKIVTLEKKLRDLKMRTGGYIRYLDIFPENPSLNQEHSSFAYSDDIDGEDEFSDLDEVGDFSEDSEDEAEEEEILFGADFDPQMRLFPENEAQALLDVMVQVMDKYPDASAPPMPDEIAMDYPDLGKKLAMAIENFFEEYGENPGSENIFDRAMGKIGKKK